MRQALGITDAVWQELNLPQLALDDLDANTPVYTDAFVALEIFHMRYPDYVRQIPRTERLWYQLVLALKNKKERRAMDRAQQEADMQREAENALLPQGTRL